MEDRAWINFEDGEEPEEHRPLQEGRYEADIRVRGTLHPEKHVRKEEGNWYWDWDQEDRYPVNSPSPEKIIRARRVGELKAPWRRVGG